jgi:nucleotide-binding universal stress UspA family protein
VHVLVSRHPAAEAIIDFAEQRKVDLIAIATHGRSGLSRWILGSVTQKVVQTAAAPVLVVRPESGAAAASE